MTKWNNKMDDTIVYGLSTVDAIKKLYNDIEQVLKQFENAQKTRYESTKLFLHEP